MTPLTGLVVGFAIGCLSVFLLVRGELGALGLLDDEPTSGRSGE